MARKREVRQFLPADSGGAAVPVKRERHPRAKVSGQSSAPALAESPVVASSAAPATPSLSTAVSDHEEIARLAYLYWEERGCQGGSAEDDWFRAEQQYRTLQS